jgi:hypothetical protein
VAKRPGGRKSGRGGMKFPSATVLFKFDCPPFSLWRACRSHRLHNARHDKPLDAEVQVFTLEYKVAIVGFRGEMFAGFACRLRKTHPSPIRLWRNWQTAPWSIFRTVLPMKRATMSRPRALGRRRKALRLGVGSASKAGSGKWRGKVRDECALLRFQPRPS